MTNKSFVVGCSGSIGGAVALELMKTGRFAGGISRERLFLPESGPPEATGFTVARFDINDRDLLEKFTGAFTKGSFRNVIYSVGHCPSGGFAEAVKYPLSELPLHVLVREVHMYIYGVLNVFQCMLPVIEDGGSFVFVSSAINRLKVFPPFLNAYHHGAVIAAEDRLIDGMRADPVVQMRDIKIHRVAPAAVDTPFHHGEGTQPPVLVPIKTVVLCVVRAMSDFDTHQDFEIVPQQPSLT